MATLLPHVGAVKAENSPGSDSSSTSSRAHVKMDHGGHGGPRSERSSASFSGDSQVDEMQGMKDDGDHGLQWHLYDNVGLPPEEQRVERSRSLTERKVWTCPVQGCGRKYWCD